MEHIFRVGGSTVTLRGKSALVALRRDEETVEAGDELGEMITPGTVVADSNGVGADFETAETASERGWGKTEGWAGPMALRKEEEGGDKLL